MVSLGNCQDNPMTSNEMKTQNNEKKKKSRLSFLYRKLLDKCLS